MNKQRHKDYKGPGCPIEAAIEIFGGKWKSIILYHLKEGPVRFNELQRRVSCVTQRMLTKQLRDLEDSGLVHREVYPEVPPRVEYSITELGRTLDPVLVALHGWGEKYAKDIIMNKQKSQG